MAKINNMNDMRELLLDELEKLRAGEIDINRAREVGALCNNVLGTINSQYAYAKLVKEKPMIPFMQNSYTIHPTQVEENRKKNLIDATPQNRLPYDKK